MTHPRSGDTVRVHYTGRLDDGRVFASSKAREPLELTVGEGTPIPSVEETLTWMEPGEERTVRVSDEQVTIDANHPLAGENLTFDLELVAVGPQRPRRRD